MRATRALQSLPAASASIKSQGTGGRSSISGLNVTVFGASGFLGRYIVNSFARIGSTTFIPYRGEKKDIDHLRVMGDLGQIVPVPYAIKHRKSVESAIAHSNVVINCIGRTFATRNFTMREANVSSARMIAESCARSVNNPHLIQLSSVGAAEDSACERLRLAQEAEDIIFSIYPEHSTVVRSTTVWGDEDAFLNKIGQMARYAPFYPMFAGARKIQPISAFDVASAIVNAARMRKASTRRTFEIGGPAIYEMEALVRSFFDVMMLRPTVLPVPEPVLPYLGKLGGLMRTPLFNEDDIRYWQLDNVVPGEEPLESLAALGVAAPLTLEDTAVNTLRKYRRALELYSIYEGTEKGSHVN